MITEFSKQTQYWLENQAVFAAAEQTFRADWEQMLLEVERFFLSRGWTTRFDCDQPHEMIKVLKPDWPSGLHGLHYELCAREYFRRLGFADLCLHVEEDVPNQSAVCQRLRSLLAPYRAGLLTRMADVSPRLLESPTHDIFKGRVDLEDASSEKLADVVHRLMETASFVDEALFLAGKSCVWRTDFSNGDPVPDLEWRKGEGDKTTGGWEFLDQGGRFASPCLRCAPDHSNYKLGSNIITLRSSSPFMEFREGERVYASAVVRAARGGEVYFCLQTTKQGSWVEIFEGTRQLKSSDQWQVLTWQGRIAPLPGYDPAKAGLYAYLIVKPLQAPLEIDSIELGLWPETPEKPFGA